MLILKNCRLIKELCEGFEEPYGDLLIEEKIIKDIKPAGFDGWPQEAQVIDAGGGTLLPGLIDMHAHVYLRSMDFRELLEYDEAATILNSYEFAHEYLMQGYTTIRDAGCMFNATVAINDAVKRGELQAAKIISSGQILTATETGNDTFGGLYIETDGADQVRAAARKQFKLKNDFIKFMATGAFLNEKGRPGLTIATLEEMKAAVEIAEMKDSYVAGHAHGSEGIKRAVEAGFRTIEHAVFIDDEAIEMILQRKDCFVVPTGAVTLVCNEDTEYLTPDMMDKALRYYDDERNAINKAYNAGLKMGFGSDLDMIDFKNHIGYEFIARTDYYNFKPIDILLQATKNSAEIMMLDDKIGTIKTGKYADLIVTDGNPDLDIKVMTKPLQHVIQEGKVIY